MKTVQKVMHLLKDENGFTDADYVAAGYAKNTVGNWRTGKADPGVDCFKKFIADMGCNYLVLLAKVDTHEIKRS